MYSKTCLRLARGAQGIKLVVATILLGSVILANPSRLIKRAGVVVTEISMPNPIVYYEIGLADSLGKPILLFKQGDDTRKAEFGRTQYYEYDITDLAAGCSMLSDALTTWAADKDHLPFGSKALADRG